MVAERFQERQNFLTPEELADAISKHSKQKDYLTRTGYSSLFNIVLDLPSLEPQPRKHWSDYREEEIKFVNIKREDLKSMSSGDRRFLEPIYNILSFWPPVRFAVFDTWDSGSEADKKIHNCSTSIVIESPYGETFRKRIILHFGYRYSTEETDWYRKWFDYTLFGFASEDKQELKQASELDLLLAANGLAQLYAERVKPQRIQITT